MIQHEYYLEGLANIQDTPFSASQLRAIIEQWAPCGSFRVLQRDEGGASQTLGSGSYIKRVAHGLALP